MTWRYAPLAAGVLIVAVAVATMGAGILLAPLGVLVTVIALRRTDHPPGPALGLGVLLNAILVLLFLGTLGVIAYSLLFE